MSRRESYPTLFDEVTNAPKDFAVRPGLRETQVDTAVRWIGPARGNCFLPSKEVEAMHSVSLGVAEDARASVSPGRGISHDKYEVWSRKASA
jgi:hypothetical protein